MKLRHLTLNIITVLAYRIFLILFFFSICRIGFYLFNHDMFPGIKGSQFLRIMEGGLKFDMSGALYINLLFILFNIIPLDLRYHRVYQRVVKYLFLITNGLGLAASCADFIYYRFIQKRATAEVFATFAHENNKGNLGFRFMFDYWPVTVLFVFIMVMLVFLYNRVRPVKPEPVRKSIYYAWNILFFLLIPGLVVGGMRGGFKHSTRPITISDATKFVDNPRDVAIVLNTPHSLLRTWNKKKLKKLNYFTPEELVTHYDPLHVPHPDHPFRKQNVIVIILESFSREYIGALNKNLDNGKYTGYTPFFDSLISVSKTFSVSIANGRKSIEAIPSVLASVPSLETPYTISDYANNRINGMAELLGKKGYYTAFFHGAPNGSMGFDSFTRLAGFKDYFGKDQYPGSDDFDGYWGIWDEPFFRFFEQKLNTFKQPFMVSIFSVSSHHPFNVPEKYKGKFKEGPVPILQTIGYTDHALHEFFDQAETEPWFDSTLFVITADHTNQLVHEVYQNDVGFYSVPIVFYQHGRPLTGMNHEVAQQADIMPTILSYLGFDENYIAFGSDLFNPDIDHFAFNSSGSIMQLFKDNYLLQMLDGKTIGLYNYLEDPMIRNNLAGKIPAVQLPLEIKMYAILQTYNERLIDNNMTVNSHTAKP